MDSTPSQLPELSLGRRFVNALTKHTVTAGGVAVIGAIILLMGYLVSVILPIFTPASIELDVEGTVPTDVIGVSSDDNFEVIVLIRRNGIAEFRDTETLGFIESQVVIDKPIRVIQRVFPTTDVYAYLSETHEIGFFRISHRVRFIDNERRIANRIEPLFQGSEITSYRLSNAERSHAFDAYLKDDVLNVAFIAEGNGSGDTIHFVEYRDADESFELEYPKESSFAIQPSDDVYLGPQGRRVILLDRETESYSLYDVRRLPQHTRISHGSLSRDNTRTTGVFTPLLGRYSLLVAYDNGDVVQWTLTSTATGTKLLPVRSLQYPAPIYSLIPEHRRKGFLAVDDSKTGYLSYSTSERVLTDISLRVAPLQTGSHIVAFNPRGDRVINFSAGDLSTYRVRNPHPEISWSTLWGKIWYEGYQDPVYSWQSSAADTDFEPKFSLTPLLFGTLKAAFYAMLYAIPLAVLGAIYTANFMSPSMRSWVKPTIEIMAALPTVILGFIAGLWFAPVLESNLTTILLCILTIPVGMFLFAYLWSRLPGKIATVSGGWYAAISAPVIVGIAWVTIAFDAEISLWLFNGDLKMLMYENLGIEYDQRNAFVIGVTMGLAVIPTIFTISEDAIYGVPQHLVHGSLALGATRWQTLVRVVLLTASPGIFSAIMIGFGRAVGETMIVLMATGNTPVMDLSIFNGMRTFAANIAVEMPESEVNSTHFRILFLTALVLFLITFAFNTVAEVVRTRLRTRYGSL